MVVQGVRDSESNSSLRFIRCLLNFVFGKFQFSQNNGNMFVKILTVRGDHNVTPLFNKKEVPPIHAPISPWSD